MNETDNEGDDVLLASLSAITEERDQALTLLARTSASLFRLLGPAENSTKMLMAKWPIGRAARNQNKSVHPGYRAPDMTTHLAMNSNVCFQCRKKHCYHDAGSASARLPKITPKSNGRRPICL